MTLLESLSVVLTGISVVFLTLMLLVALLTLMGWVQKKPSPPTVSAVAEQPPQKLSSIHSDDLPAPEIESGISDEVVAVISASLAAVMADDVPYQVKSIRRHTPRSRNAWSQTALQEITRSFDPR